MDKAIKQPHQGRNIRFFREAKNIKQEAFADMLDMAQSSIPNIERREIIEDELLNKCALILGVSIETLKDFDVDTALRSISGNTFNYNIEKIENSASLTTIGENETINHFNPIEKLVEVYDKMIVDKDEQIKALTNALNKCSKKV